MIIWFTGLPNSGKSTTAYAVKTALLSEGHSAFVLDGDEVRQGLCSDLGFSVVDRQENIRRIAEVAKLISDGGAIAIVACVSPFEASRTFARSIAPNNSFIEVYMQGSNNSSIKEFTGEACIYEPPRNPEVRMDISVDNVRVCTNKIMLHTKENT